MAPQPSCRINRQPVVVCRLTVDELRVCVGLCSAGGLLLGLVLAWAYRQVGVDPHDHRASSRSRGVRGGNVLHHLKRGQPATWLYRHLEWRIPLRYPLLFPFIGGDSLVTRSGHWTMRRGSP